jgi:hypothetical protein
MSAGETRAYHCLIYDRNVVTVKEQYPLDYIKTQAIANKHGVIHPRDHQTGEVNIMTTDFLVEYVDKDGSHYKEAWSYKPELKAGNYARTQQKFEIEKAYWHAYGVKFGIKLDADVCNNTAYNYEELADQYTNHVSETELVEYTKAFLTFVARFPQETLRATLLELHERFSGQPSPRYLFANAVLRHILPLDVSQPIDFIEPARLLPV